MMDEHIPEHELAVFAFDPDTATTSRSIAIQQHTAACGECRARLDFFSVTEEDLADPDVWERSAGSATLETLRAYGERIAEEDEEAEELLAPFFASPVTIAMTNLQTLGRRYVTGGVVRRLNAHAHSICESEPLDALTFADAAVTVSELLPESTYPARAVFELRGTAWKERANAQMRLGDFPRALESLVRAERAYRQLVSPALGLATVALVRAGVLYEQNRLDEAALFAQEAERGFAHLGDDERRMRALHLRGSIKVESGDVEGAIACFQQVLEYGDSVDEPLWLARAGYAIGHCQIERKNLSEATMHFHKSLLIFREVGSVGERIAAAWGLARVVLEGGKPLEAVRLLRNVAAEFETRGMVTHAALARLDVADALLSLGETKQIVDMATKLFLVFKDAGMLTGALTAIAYIKEAAAAGRLTTEGVEAVRTFLRRAERQPDLVFLPPDTFRSAIR